MALQPRMGDEAPSPRGEGHAPAPLAEGLPPPPPTLPDLPLDVLVGVCAHLRLCDRLALTSCCRTLLERPDIVASEALWGNLDLHANQFRPQDRQDDSPPAVGQQLPALPAAALVAWFGRRRAALGSLQLDFGQLEVSPLSVLCCVAGSPLTSIRLCGLPGEAAPLPTAAGLEALSTLTALRSATLFQCNLKQVPSQLAALGGTLRQLSVAANPQLSGASDAAWQPLAALTTLTSLSVEYCRLPRPPPYLSCLRALAELSLAFNELGAAPSEAWGPLSLLSSVTCLDISSCNLATLPQQLSLLRRLAHLELGSNPLGFGEGWDPLLSLTVLTRLRMSRLEVPALPAQLSALTALRELDACRCTLGAAEACQPLGALTALTKLRLRRNGLRGLPRELAALPALLELDLRESRKLHEAGELAWEALRGLSALRRLNISQCGLSQLPCQLAACSGTLQELDVSKNRLHPRPEGGSLAGTQVLRCLTALTRLSVSSCCLLSLPQQLDALSRLQSLDLSYNWDARTWLGDGGEGAWGPLAQLTALSALTLKRIGLRRLPSQLTALGSCLRRLDLGRNDRLGGAGEAAWEPLRSLTALTYLDLWCCELARVPAQVAALGSLETLELSANRGLGAAEGEEAWSPLLSLPALSRVVVAECGLQRRPPLPSAVKVILRERVHCCF